MRLAGARKKIRIGDLLVEAGAITEEQLQEALAKQKEEGGMLGNVIMDLGFISRELLITVLTAQLGIDYCEIQSVKIDEDVVDLVSKDLVQKYKVMPIGFSEDNPNILQVAMADPLDLMAIDDISIASGYQIEPLISFEDDIKFKCLYETLYYCGLRRGECRGLQWSDIDWNKDVIYIKQQKTGHFLNIPLRQSYGNVIAEYILSERPACKSDYLFVRELAPFSRLDGEGASIRTIMLKVEALACVTNKSRGVGSRTTRHNAASSMLRSGVPMADISAVLGHQDPDIVSVYLSTDEDTMASCTLPLPGGDCHE